jgi:hypothetical protein
MTRNSEIRSNAPIKRALALVTEAMDLLDAHDGPPEAAALLDLARQQLSDTLRSEGV